MESTGWICVDCDNFMRPQQFQRWTSQPVLAHCLKNILDGWFPGFVQWWGAHHFLRQPITLLDSESCEESLPHTRWKCLHLILPVGSGYALQPHGVVLFLFLRDSPYHCTHTCHAAWQVFFSPSDTSQVFKHSSQHICRPHIIVMFFAVYVAVYDFHFNL